MSSRGSLVSLPLLTQPYWQHLPIEVTWRIVAQIPLYYGWPLKPDKKGLASCSLVCRYCAEYIRPVLFECLELRGPGDVDDLFNILASAPVVAPELSTLIQRIIYVKSDNRVPAWLRLRTILNIAPAAKLYVLISPVDNPNGQAPTAIDGNSILRCLPRALPTSALPSLGNLDISHVRFAAVSHLTNLVHAFPAIDHLHYYHMSCGDNTLPFHRLQRRHRWGKYGDVTLHRGADLFGLAGANFDRQLEVANNWLAVRERLVVGEDVWDMVQKALVDLVPGGSVLESVALVNSDVRTKHCHLTTSLDLPLSENVLECCIVGTTRSQPEVSGPLNDICKITLMLPDSGRFPSPFDSLPWSAFEDRLLRIQPVPMLRIVPGRQDSVLNAIWQGKLFARMARRGRLVLSESYMESTVTVEEVISHLKASSSGDEPAPNTDSVLDYRYHCLLEEKESTRKKTGQSKEAGSSRRRERDPSIWVFRCSPMQRRCCAA